MPDHPIFAAVYDRMLARAEARGLADRRRRLLAEARGSVLEVGGGTGLNLPYYRDVDRLVVLEPDAAMRRRLLERLPRAAVPVEVHEGGIDEVAFPDATFDTIVVTLVFCSVPDLDAATARMRRLLKPDGRLLFLEHVASPGLRGRAQSLAQPLWGRLAGGCHLDRDPLTSLRGNGFVITACDKFDLAGTSPLTKAAVQGVARLAPVPA